MILSCHIVGLKCQKLIRFEQTFKLLKPIFQSERSLPPSMLGAMIEGSHWILASFVKNKVYEVQTMTIYKADMSWWCLKIILN